MPDFKKFNQDTYSNETRLQKLKVKRTRKGRFILTVFCILTILAAMAYASFVYADDVWVFVADKYFNNRINAAGSEMPAKGDNHWLNIMLIGIDQRSNEPSRSDTLMVAMLNLQNKSVQVISIPRDTRVKIEGIENRTKINHAHSTGGVESSRKTVEALLGIPIHNYVETNFVGFEKIIDDLGGVDLNVEKRMYYPAEDIDLHKGLQHLGGHDALAYVRFRSDGKGDLPRIERQHKFLKNLAEAVLSPKTLLKLPGIADELHSNLNTDMSVQDLIVLAGEFKNIKPENIRFADLPGEPNYINGASYYVVNEEKLKLFMDKTLKGENPETVSDKGASEVLPER